MEQQQQQQQAPPHLKCPRCDSSNTKFCYYNNYSLSQPRHLCKACKRYWTRGGILRNVPVGGKCRKNKRDLHKQTSSSVPADHVKPSTTVQSSTSQVDVSSSTTSTRTHIKNPKRDGKDLSFTQFCNMGGGDELGFLTSQNYLSQNLKPAGDDVANISNQVFSGYPLFGISSSTTTTPTMASIIASCLDQQNMDQFNGFKEESGKKPYGFLGLDDDVHQMLMRNNGEGNHHQLVKDAKMEEGNNGNKLDWKTNSYNEEEMKFESDVPFMWNSSSAAWLDSSSNIGSNSVPSLI